MNETTIDRAKLRETVVHIRGSYPEAWNYTENLDIRALADCAIKALDALDAADVRMKALEELLTDFINGAFIQGSDSPDSIGCSYCHRWGHYTDGHPIENNIVHKASCEVLEAMQILHPGY